MLEILLLEPNIESGVPLCSLLRAQGYRVIFAQDSTLGIHLMKSYIPHVVIVNMQVLETAGDAFLRMLKHHLAAVKVLVIPFTHEQNQPDQLIHQLEQDLEVHMLVEPVDQKAVLELLSYQAQIQTQRNATPSSTPKKHSSPPKKWRSQTTSHDNHTSTG